MTGVQMRKSILGRGEVAHQLEAGRELVKPGPKLGGTFQRDIKITPEVTNSGERAGTSLHKVELAFYQAGVSPLGRKVLGGSEAILHMRKGSNQKGAGKVPLRGRDLLKKK